jgi:hypothetical protein
MRFAIEHLPKTPATYQVTPADYSEARRWLADGEVVSLIRTTELIGAIRAGLGASLDQADQLTAMRRGDEALLITLSFSVLLAWAEGDIVPLEADWRCLIVRVADPDETIAPPVLTASQDLPTDVKNSE